jgi:hypothetical protein
MLTSIAMGRAHLFELPNKINISAADYLTVQRNYDNWWIVGLSVPLAFISVLGLAISLRGTGTPFTFALIAVALLVARWSRSGASRRRSTARPRIGRCCRAIGRNCATNGNIPTRCEQFSTWWRWERSSCPFSTGAPRPPGEPARRRAGQARLFFSRFFRSAFNVLSASLSAASGVTRWRLSK